MNYRFSVEFQKHILASVISDGEFLKENADVVRPEFFGDEVLAGIAHATFAFYRKHKEVPTRAGLRQELRALTAPGRKLHEYHDELDEIYKLVGVNARYYQDQAVAFARAQAVQGAIRASIPLIEQGEIEEVGRLVSDALKVGQFTDSSGVYDYFDMAPDRLRHYLNGHSKDDRLATGLSTLDDCMNGGLGKGELGVIVALPGFGKTTTLVNFGARALLQDKRVVYVTLELSKKMIASKFDNSIFGRTLDRIKNEPKEFAHALRDLKAKLTGRLFIAEFPTKGLTIERMGSVIQKIGGVDLVLVDYGQLVKPPRRRDDRRHEITDTYEGLRRLASELQVPIWTAHQANRPGTDSKVIRMEHIAEDFNVAATCDIAISVNHTEEEQRRGAMRLYVMKSRIGPAGVQIDCNVNWKTARITLLG